MYRVLVCIPETARSMKLRNALDSTGLVHSLTVARDLFGVKEILKQGDVFDIVFIQGSIASKQTLSLVAELRAYPQLTHATVIAVTSEFSKSNFSVAQNALSSSRINGILLEPFSVDSLTKVMNIAATSPKTITGLTMHRVLKLLVKEIVDQISLISRQIESGQAANINRLTLTDTASVLKELPESAQQLYFEFLMERCLNSRPRYKIQYRSHNKPKYPTSAAQNASAGIIVKRVAA